MLTLQIFYASRTHSQLAQFASEIKRCSNAADVHAVTLGSRKALCTNEAVRELQSVNRINDRCLELQQQTHSSETGCPFLKDTAVRVVRDRLLADVCDVEEATAIGRGARGCAYYGSRKAAAQAEVFHL